MKNSAKSFGMFLTFVSFTFLFLFGCKEQQSSQVSLNKELISKYYAEVLNTRNADLIPQYVAEDINYYRADHKGDRVGIKAFTDCFQLNNELFTDLNFDIQEMIAEGDKVMVRFHGTARTIPEDSAIDVDGVRIYTIRDGKIKEKWELIDDYQLLVQTGRLESIDYPHKAKQAGE